MSMSLYYKARRTQPISLKEKVNCEAIVERYNAQYPYEELYESFCVYDLLKNGYEEDNVIFNGATKLPMDCSEEFFCRVGYYWLECLEEITIALPGAQWHINIDDVDLNWDENEHERFPIDGEWD